MLSSSGLWVVAVPTFGSILVAALGVVATRRAQAATRTTDALREAKEAWDARTALVESLREQVAFLSEQNVSLKEELVEARRRIDRLETRL